MDLKEDKEKNIKETYFVKYKKKKRKKLKKQISRSFDNKR